MNQIESTDTALRLAIVRRAFSTRLRGYDTGEVDEVLETVSALADDLLRETAGTSRHLAEAEAELISTRAEIRELREAKAGVDHLLAATRAELRAERHSRDLDSEAEERLVVAEAEIRLVRAAAEGTERALELALAELEGAHAARAEAEDRLADTNSRLADLAVDRAPDPLADIGAEIADLLRAAAGAAATARRRAGEEADALLAEARELAATLLDDAEHQAAAAEARGCEIIESASADAAAIMTDAFDAAEMIQQGGPLGLAEAAGSMLLAAGDSSEHAPFAMEGNGPDNAD